MSLNYLFVKADGPIRSLAELEADRTYKLQDYKKSGMRLFPGVNWNENNYTSMDIQGVRIEVDASDFSLSGRLPGLAAKLDVVFKLAAECLGENVAIIDAQTSELVTAETIEQSAEEYLAWHRSVLGQHE